MVGFTAQRLMELEAESLTGAPYASAGGQGQQRTVFRDRTWDRRIRDRAGTIELRVPNCATAVFSWLLEPRRMAEKR